ncbi:hypothetical protein M0R45_006028 [Rubus argutus]|uniref:HAT C-terminal dimerisation domain-containing protein n=1 Tax=Rubus argutus TaxID=59490 RepID=A0AAW1YPS2_RUBAR
MDPRIKLNGLELMLSEIEKNLSITMPLKLSTIQKNFNDTYKLYEKKYAAASVQDSQTPHRASLSASKASSSQVVFGLLASKAKQKGGRVLDEKRTRLTPKNLEALMCVKDWDDAYYRAQSFVDEDLACEEEENKSTLSISID